MGSKVIQVKDCIICAIWDGCILAWDKVSIAGSFHDFTRHIRSLYCIVRSTSPGAALYHA